MQKNNYLFLFLLIFTVFSCSKGEAPSNSESVHGTKNESYYTCPMHPEIHDHGPGSCPICGMPLVKVSQNEKGAEGKNHLLPTDYQKKVLNFTQTKVAMDEVIFKLQSSGRVMNSKLVSFYIYEADRPFVKVGQKFEGQAASTNNLMHGVITSIDNIADPSSRAIRVIGKLTGKDAFTVTEGSFFGTINSAPQNVLMAPDDAVLRTGKKNIVYVVDEGGEIFPKEVELGRSQGDKIEILKGLSEGAVIASGPNFLLDSEARIRGFDD